jgi:putative phosphoribosyl transferase
MTHLKTILSHQDIEIPLDNTEKICGSLDVTVNAKGIIIFAHGSGSSRFSPRNQYVSHTLQEKGFATLLFDLLTEHEEITDSQTGRFRFDIHLLTERLILATKWCQKEDQTSRLNIGYFGASTGAAAALCAAAQLSESIKAVVSRGGRADLAIKYLPNVTAPTLLIVGGDDTAVLEMNRRAAGYLKAEHKLLTIPSATHLFEEPGALEEVARVSAQWFEIHLTK